MLFHPVCSLCKYDLTCYGLKLLIILLLLLLPSKECFLRNQYMLINELRFIDLLVEQLLSMFSCGLGSWNLIMLSRQG